MTDLLKVEGKLRTETGKNYCRRLRVQGLIPANLLGKPKPVMLEIPAKQISLIWKTGKKFTLAYDGQEKNVEIHELQLSPVSRRVVHLDLISR